MNSRGEERDHNLKIKPKTAIVNYGVGNLRSVKKGLEKAGAVSFITNDIAEAFSADAVVLPGVGAFKSAMQAIAPHLDVLKKRILSGIPLLGICLGMQLLFSRSMEGGTTTGLNIIPGKVVRLPKTVKTPHMGWNTIKIRKSPLTRGLASNAYVYFVHSYYAVPSNPETVSATTEYGIEFPSIISSDHIFGTQFHPEKSGKPGLIILRNFVQIARGLGNEA